MVLAVMVITCVELNFMYLIMGLVGLNSCNELDELVVINIVALV